MGTWFVAGIPYSDELYHHGIKGQKWGERRFQYEDGSLTPAGYKRYDIIEQFGISRKKSKQERIMSAADKIRRSTTVAKIALQRSGITDISKELSGLGNKRTLKAYGKSKNEIGKSILKEATKATLLSGTRVAGACLGAYGANKVVNIASKAILTKKLVNGYVNNRYSNIPVSSFNSYSSHSKNFS